MQRAVATALAPCLLRRCLLRRIEAAPALKGLEVLMAVKVFCATAVFALVDIPQQLLTRPGRLVGIVEDSQVLSTIHAKPDDIVLLLLSVDRSEMCGTFVPLKRLLTFLDPSSSLPRNET